jgi:hypothetical protein
MDQSNPFAAPRVELVDARAPRPLSGWNPGQLRLLGWLNLVSVLATLVVMGLAFVPDLVAMTDWLSVASTLLGCYLALRLKAFLEARFAARGLKWPVWLGVVLGLVLEVAQLYWGEAELMELSVPSYIYFGLMALLGLVLLWQGIVLLKVVEPYALIRVLAWLYVASGALVASVIFMMIGILPLLAATVVSALVFFRGAQELEGSQAA